VKHKKLNRRFFNRPTLLVAKDLLGKILVRRLESGKILRGKIIETEAYIGPRDKASHAFGGRRTKRNEAEWLSGGHVYIYLVYGMHWQLNFSTAGANQPECVLIRALDVAEEENPDLANGPGKLCRYLKLDKSFYGLDAARSRRLWLEDRGVKIEPRQIKATARVGIDYAGPFWAKRKWRFVLKRPEKKLLKNGN